jgi:heme A synthase
MTLKEVAIIIFIGILTILAGRRIRSKYNTKLPIMILAASFGLFLIVNILSIIYHISLNNIVVVVVIFVVFVSIIVYLTIWVYLRKSNRSKQVFPHQDLPPRD